MTGIPAPDQVPDAYRDGAVALVTGAGDLREPCAEALRSRGWAVHIDDAVPEGLDRLDLVVDCLEATGHDAQATALGDALLRAGQAQPLLETASREARAGYLVVTRLDGRLGLSGTATEDRALLGGAPGLAKTLAVEAPDLYCRAVDFAPELDPAACAELFLAEVHDAETALTEVGLAAPGERYTVGLAAEPDGTLPGGVEVAPPGADDLLVVTGGARGVTAACATGLARAHRPGLLLLGRTPLADEPDWADGVAEDGLRAAAAAELKRTGAKPTPREVERIARDLTGQREIRRTLADLREAGSEAEYLAVDITDENAVREALAPYRERITGVVHGAGVLADGLVKDKQAAEVQRVLGTKVTGLRHVLGAVPREQMRHVMLFSSVAGFFGNRGQSDYAMANEALNRWACALRRRDRHTRVTSINWGAWAGGMVTPELEKMFAERGITLIGLEEGVGHFVEQFDAERGGDTVCVVGPDTPLSEAEPAPLPDDGLVLHRDLSPTAADSVIADHAIGGAPVLPAAAAIGGALGAVRRAAPGAEASGVSGFAVYKGVVFDDDAPTRLSMAVRPTGAASYDVVMADDAGRPRYRAGVRTEAKTAPPQLRGLPQPGSGEPVPYYEDGTLFHGPSLRGITELLDPGDGGSGLVLTARLGDSRIAAGAWHADRYSPVLADLLLQAVLVWARVHRGEAVLPTGVEEVDLFDALPDDEPFLLAVDGAEPTAGGVRCTVTACTPDGRVLQRFGGVEAVRSPGLDTKFLAQPK
ncbi:SDR family NAD(P)-dependent oxidoreductase [Glycomyces xiaoerkulensis]|uniref:SDR family NAD(P)-dependent oxidoreductase n=1 Tax=Glycomyces xiaoerkulensis TaxID=2038139 RepID=UPI0018E4DA81|nr:SDR family NAD(P)-dependent oxidoreductase [Glycomyces xiaoerkulensis]